MEALISEWLNLLVRWTHFVAGVMWIGSSIFFTWMNANFLPSNKPGVEGELWMVHGGGFYVVEKKHVAPDQLPSVLHWFKWEAMFTMLSGILLLILVFYMGGGALMLDPTTAKVSPQGAIGVGIAAIIFFWFVYDGIWRSPLSKQPWIAAALTATILITLSALLAQVLSGRAAYIHTGAMMGVTMVLNVWVHIIPGQRALVEATRKGEKPDPAQGKRGKMRSLHNHYMTFPVLFIMLSNHFPSTYGSTWNWQILAALMIVSALVKHWMNVVDPGAHVLVGLLLTALAVAVANPFVGDMLRKDDAVAVPTGPRRAAIDPSSTGAVAGVVKLTGTPPPDKKVTLFGGCERGHDGPVTIPAAVVDGTGGLKDAFVWIKTGAESYEPPPVPPQEVVVDQRGCLYTPVVVGARVGQKVTFVNDDPLYHNVRSVSAANEPFNVGQPAQGQRDTKVFKKPEVMVQTRCDVHPWMTAHIGVVDHPWFAVTGDGGAFRFDGVPAGHYTVGWWHEAVGSREAALDVAAGGVATLTLEGSASP